MFLGRRHEIEFIISGRSERLHLQDESERISVLRIESGSGCMKIEGYLVYLLRMLAKRSLGGDATKTNYDRMARRRANAMMKR